jgi:hypothetical protein
MGTLKEGATYIYERVDNVVYSREVGADPSTRTIIGWELLTGTDDLHASIKNSQLWADIRRSAETNITLQRLLEQCIIVYRLSKEYEDQYGNRKT